MSGVGVKVLKIGNTTVKVKINIQKDQNIALMWYCTMFCLHFKYCINQSSSSSELIDLLCLRSSFSYLNYNIQYIKHINT